MGGAKLGRWTVSTPDSRVALASFLSIMDEHLQRGEMVLASCGRVHATDRRVIFQDTAARLAAGDPSVVTFPALPYSWIESARLVTRFRMTTVALGSLVAFLAIVADPMAPLQAIAFALGAIGIVTGFLSRSRALEVRSRSEGGSPPHRADPVVHRWDLGEASADAAGALLRTVRTGVAHPAALVSDDAPVAEVPSVAEDSPSGAATRSVAVVPADRPLWVRDAMAWGADVLCLDSVLREPERRDLAYQVAWAEVAAVSAAGRQLWVWVDADDLESGLSACVWPGVAAVVVRVESAGVVRRVETVLAALEAGRGIPGPVGIVGVIESGDALWSLREMAGASARIRAVALGLGDLTDEDPAPQGEPSPNMGLRPVSAREHLWGRAILGATSAGVPLLGRLRLNAADDARGAPASRAGMDAAVRAAWSAGFSGALTSSADGVLACNAEFDPAPPPEEAPEALDALDADVEAETEDSEPPPGAVSWRLADGESPEASWSEEAVVFEDGAESAEAVVEDGAED